MDNSCTFKIYKGANYEAMDQLYREFIVKGDALDLQISIMQAYVDHLQWDWTVLTALQFKKCVKVLDLDIWLWSASTERSEVLTKWLMGNLVDGFLSSNLHLLKTEKHLKKTFEPRATSKLFAYYKEKDYGTSLTLLTVKLYKDYYWNADRSNPDITSRLSHRARIFDLNRIEDQDMDVSLFITDLILRGEDVNFPLSKLGNDRSLLERSDYQDMSVRIFIRKNLPTSIGNYMDRQNGSIIKNSKSVVNEENPSSWLNMFGFAPHEHIVNSTDIDSSKQQ